MTLSCGQTRAVCPCYNNLYAKRTWLGGPCLRRPLGLDVFMEVARATATDEKDRHSR